MIEWMDNKVANPYGLQYAKGWVDIFFKMKTENEKLFAKSKIYDRLIYAGIRKDYAYEYTYNGMF